MKFYNANTEYGFGKYKGMTLDEVYNQNSGYIEWCLMNLDHLVIDDSDLEQLYERYPGTKLSAEAEKARQEKLDRYYEQEDDQDWQAEYDPMDDYGTSGKKYGWYNGWSDDVIDDAFEGDPDATWNVD